MDDPLGRPTGRPGRSRVSAPRSEGIGLRIPPREMDATERFDLDESELQDLPDENLMSTARHFTVPDPEEG